MKRTKGSSRPLRIDYSQSDHVHRTCHGPNYPSARNFPLHKGKNYIRGSLIYFLTGNRTCSVCLASTASHPCYEQTGTRDTVHVDQFITRTRCIIQTLRVHVSHEMAAAFIFAFSFGHAARSASMSSASTRSIPRHRDRFTRVWLPAGIPTTIAAHILRPPSSSDKFRVLD